MSGDLGDSIVKLMHEVNRLDKIIVEQSNVIAEQDQDIDNLKAELEAAYEFRRCVVVKQELPIEEVIAQAAVQIVKATRKPREQEMNEKKMGC